nr:probable LRR receptor-like serine/threonine-protein kinase At4g37250 [Ipomoea batatas]
MTLTCEALRVTGLALPDSQILGSLVSSLGMIQFLRNLDLSNNSRLYRFQSRSLHGGFDAVQELDLSSNLINGSLPPNYGGTNLRYLNVSFNRFFVEIPPEFSSRIPPNATLDLSFNNLSSEIPDSSVFLNQDVKAFAGNPELCGVPLENLCHASSEPTSPPAIAAIPKTIHSNPAADSPDSVAILALIFIYTYRAKRRKAIEGTIKKEAESAKNFDWASSSASPTEYNWLRSWTCLKTQRHIDADADVASETTASESSESPKGQTPQMQAEQKTDD